MNTAAVQLSKNKVKKIKMQHTVERH